MVKIFGRPQAMRTATLNPQDDDAEQDQDQQAPANAYRFPATSLVTRLDNYTLEYPRADHRPRTAELDARLATSREKLRKALQDLKDREARELQDGFNANNDDFMSGRSPGRDATEERAEIERLRARIAELETQLGPAQSPDANEADHRAFWDEQYRNLELHPELYANPCASQDEEILHLRQEVADLQQEIRDQKLELDKAERALGRWQEEQRAADPERFDILNGYQLENQRLQGELTIAEDALNLAIGESADIATNAATERDELLATIETNRLASEQRDERLRELEAENTRLVAAEDPFRGGRVGGEGVVVNVNLNGLPYPAEFGQQAARARAAGRAAAEEEDVELPHNRVSQVNDIHTLPRTIRRLN